MTRHLLETQGVPVPEGALVASAEEAWATAEEGGLPVFLTPSHGTLRWEARQELSTRDQVLAAYEALAAEGNGVLVERSVSGTEYNLLVVGDRSPVVTLEMAVVQPESAKKGPLADEELKLTVTLAGAGKAALRPSWIRMDVSAEHVPAVTLFTFAPDAVRSEIVFPGPTCAFSFFGGAGVATVPEVKDPRMIVGCASHS